MMSLLVVHSWGTWEKKYSLSGTHYFKIPRIGCDFKIEGQTKKLMSPSS